MRASQEGEKSRETIAFMETTRALTENLRSLLRREHEALAEFLVALAEFDRRRVWVELGHSSLWYFLHRELRLSKSAAQYRKVAAELIQQIPGIIEPLRRGDLCLTSLIEVAKVVTTENWERVLPRFYGLSRREAMEVVAELHPHPAPPVRTVVTPVRSVSPSLSDAPAWPTLMVSDPQPLLALAAGESSTQAPARATSSSSSLRVSSSAEPDPSTASRSAPPVASAAAPVAAMTAVTPAAQPRPFEVVPLTADRSRLHFTVSKGFMKKLEAARDALSHAMPGATPAEILEAGLELLLAQVAKRRGLVAKPQKKPRPAKGDHIPAHVRREVWERDGGKCQYPLAAGGVCGSTRDLELDHIHPQSLGGGSTADNLRVACRPHNDLAARLLLGDDLMDRYTSGLARPSRAITRAPAAARATGATRRTGS